MHSSEVVWDRFETTLSKKAPALLATLLLPATLDELHDAEEELDLIFPDELRYAYLRHNGSIRHARPCFFLPECSNIHSLAEVKEYWGSSREFALINWVDECDSSPDSEFNQGKVRADVWNTARIPIGHSSGATHIFMDLLPGTIGTVGQLVKDSDFMGEFTDASVFVSGLNEYLTLFTDRLEQGLIVCSPQNYWLNERGQEGFDWATLMA